MTRQAAACDEVRDGVECLDATTVKALRAAGGGETLGGPSRENREPQLFGVSRMRVICVCQRRARAPCVLSYWRYNIWPRQCL